MKQADRPDSVRGSSCDSPRDRHSSGPGIAARLGATYPPALRAASTLAYLVLLRVEIARFTRTRRSLVRAAVRLGAFAPTVQNTRSQTRFDSSLLL